MRIFHYCCTFSKKQEWLLIPYRMWHEYIGETERGDSFIWIAGRDTRTEGWDWDTFVYFVDLRQPSPQNLIQKGLSSVINPHGTTISAAAPSMCKPLHRSTPWWGALHSCRCCGDQYAEHVPKQASLVELAWITFSRATALGLAQSILAWTLSFKL